MGLRRLPDWLPWPGGKSPALLEWPGASTPSGHPSWKKAARALRDGDGAMLPTLFRRYRRFLGFDLQDAGRIAVVAFSAGSNSAVRELLRSPLDRARLSFVAAVDGMHPMLSGAVTEAPEGNYIDWPGQMGPLAAFALDAAQNEGPAFVCSASQVPASSSRVAPSMLAMASLSSYVTQRLPPGGPWMPPAYPPRSSSPKLRAGEPYPVPFAVGGAKRFACLWYPGADKRAHELQAWVVVPDLLRAFLIPLWGGPEPILVGAGPEPTEPPDLEHPPRSSVRGLPNWTPAAIATAAIAGVAFAPY